MASALLSLDVEIPATGRGEKKKHKKKRKQLERDSVSDVATRRGVIYVGHLPHGFFESQLKDYFSQFGTVTKVHVSRNKKVRYNNNIIEYNALLCEQCHMVTTITSLHSNSIFGVIFEVVKYSSGLYCYYYYQCTMHTVI